MKLKSFNEFMVLYEQALFEADLETARREYNDILNKMGLDVDDPKSLYKVADKVDDFLKDPVNKKNFLKGLDDGNPPVDDKVKIEGTSIEANKLKPSQDSIYLDQSIKGYVTRVVEKYLKQILSGKLVAPDIFISEDNYVLDGHHRWSAVMALNPEAKMEITRINLPIFVAIPVLNAILRAEGAEVQRATGDAKTNIWKGLEGEEKDYKAVILKTLKDAVTEKDPYPAQEQFIDEDGKLDKLIEFINKNGFDHIKDENILAKHIYDHIKEIPTPEKIFPPRDQMPQFPQNGEDTKHILNAMQSGEFDIKKGENPKSGLHKTT